MNVIKNPALGLFIATLFAAAFHLDGYSQALLDLSESERSFAAIAENRPFDFSDKYYEKNGLFSGMFLDRRSGADGRSVIDFIRDPDHREVRITEIFPAYGTTGETLFWNLYAEFGRVAFVPGPAGEEAHLIADRYPVFVFPSSKVRYSDRQSALIEIDDGYDAKNPMGLGVAVRVEFTAEIYTKRGQYVMQEMIKRNGASLDGTPIIRTAKEIGELTRAGYITQQTRDPNTGDALYRVARVITDPTRGAIAPDAFLNFVKQENGKPLVAEIGIVEHFTCLQRSGEMCRK